jgi:hypothetical protein
MFFLAMHAIGAAELRSTGIASIRIKGSSSLHDWQMHSFQLQGGVRLGLSGIVSVGDLLQRISRGSVPIQGGFAIPVSSLHSGKSAMDAKAYAALKQKQFSQIHIRLRSYRFLQRSKGNYHLRVAVRLKVAGQSRTISVPVRLWQPPKKGGLRFASEELTLRITDFGIRPPRAMLGLLHTGDRVRVAVCGKLTWHPS